METIEALSRRLQSTKDLQSVVKTMKALAAVKIRQFEKAVEALEDYNRTVEMGLQIVLRLQTEVHSHRDETNHGSLAAVVFGSDQGMCGQLNDQIVSLSLDRVGKLGLTPDRCIWAAIGERAAGRLRAEGITVEEFFSLPGSVKGITAKVEDILLTIEAWHDSKKIDRVYLFYAKPHSGTSYRPHFLRLLPVDRAWLERLKADPWPTKMLPVFTMDRDTLFSELIGQYLFVSIFRAFAESMASENASRLASMQGAERNIEDQLADLTNRYHQLRQMSITEELLDIVSGFETLEHEQS